jgi:two-component system, sensor histidine kinase and response regulator
MYDQGEALMTHVEQHVLSPAEDSTLDARVLGQAVLAVPGVAVIGMDAAGRIVEWNDAAETMFGRRRRDAIGRDLARTIVPPALRAAHRRGLRRYLADRRSRLIGETIEQTALRADGTEFRK